jgi:pyridinium-3,5-biscarboxylic acid mononucleotide sulfurtransferase
MTRMTDAGRLAAILRQIDRADVAVSGGVDSLTLAACAHDVLGPRARMHHAVSPAVPPEATRRTETLAKERGWDLHILDAGEFADENYRANPADRCFFCKTNLYGAIAARAARTLPSGTAPSGTLLSGTNTDDLADWRPGLRAAAEHGVRHPFVEAGIDKAGVRRLAAAFGLGEIATLPASPCLSSRIETGLRVEPALLALVHEAERLVAEALAPRTVRARVRRDGLVVELDEAALARLDDARAALTARLSALAARPVRFAGYRMGSAFLRPAS